MGVPGFERLDPGLSWAESLLRAGEAMAAVGAALPDESAAADSLNALLADCGATPRLRRCDRGWRIVTLAGAPGTDTVVIAAIALAGLVAADGWRRVKRCARPGCGGAFIDRTNAASRRYCRQHSRHRGSGSALLFEVE